MNRDRKKHFWQDRYGSWNIPSVLGAAFFGVTVLVVVIVCITAYAQNVGCHDRLAAYGLHGRYSFWANTCFADLPGGAVNVDNLRQDSKGYTLYTPDLPVNR